MTEQLDELVMAEPAHPPAEKPKKKKASPLRTMGAVPPNVARSIVHKAARFDTEEGGRDEFVKFARRAKLEIALLFEWRARNLENVGEAKTALDAFLKVVDALSPKPKAVKK